jgi:catechol 2,3-dioxygenase-like lactoylglutathione lyase family enzyme
MKILGIDNVLVAVGDLAEARRFYHEVLGLPVVLEVAEQGIILFELGGETPGLLAKVSQHPSAEPGHGMRLWLEVADARAAAAELGLEPLAPPLEVFTGWTVEFADPWGNRIGFTDYTKKPELGR